MSEKQGDLEAFLAEEVVAEAARRRLRHNAIQRQAGVLPRAWGHYFIQRDRNIPVDILIEVGRAIGVPASELMRRAEARAVADPGLPDDFALAAHTGERQRPFDSQLPDDE